jgi:hypothetical protein
MKNYIFILFIFVSTFSVANNHHNPIFYQVVSEELPSQDGTLLIKVKLKFAEDSIYLNGDIIGTLGFSENFTLNDQSLDNLFFEDDSMEVAFTIQSSLN